MSFSRNMLRLVGIVAALGLPVEAARPPYPSPEDRIYRKIAAARLEAGGSALERRDDLDAVARDRAEEIASRPAHRRVEGDEPIGRFLERSGGLYHRATERLILLKNISLVDGVVERWQAQSGAWQTLTTAELDGVGLGTAEAADGWIVFVAILVRDLVVMDSPEEIAALEQEVLDRVNAIRRGRQIPELVPRQDLAGVARAHAADMVARDYFSHASPSGSRPAGRVRNAGIRFQAVAENLTMNNSPERPAEQAVADWMGSPAHRKNILDERFRQTGVGVAVTEDGRYHFTQLFLVPR